MSVGTTSMAPAQKDANEKYCVECAQVIRMNAEICPGCGVRQPGIGPAAPAYPVSHGRTKSVAAILAFFLGGVGGHKFYLGQPGMGFLYLAFCWTFIPAIIAFIEFIMYLTMSDEEFSAKYN